MNTLSGPFSLTLIISLFIRSVVSGGVISQNRADVCQTDQCRDVSRMLESNMNHTVAPCDDLYEYVCGKFAETYKPKHSATWHHYESVRQIAQITMIEYLNTPVNETDNHLIKWAKSHFKACMNKRRLDEVGVKPLLDKMKEYGGRILCKKVTFGPPREWQQVHVLYNRIMGKGSVFTIGVRYIPDFDENMITIGITEDVFVHTRGSLKSSDIEKYTQFLVDISTQMCDFCCKASLTKSGRVAIQKVIHFRESFTKTKDTFSTETPGCLKSIHNLQEETNRKMSKEPVDWLHLINSMFGSIKYVSITDSTRIYIKNLPLLLAALKVIDDTPKQVIRDHLHFFFLENYIRYSNTKMYEVYQGMHTKVLPLRSIACVSDRALTRAVNFIYVQHILPKDTIPMAEKIVQDVRRAFKDQISTTHWMTRLTKRISTNNVDMMYGLFEYEDWDKNINNVVDYYSHLPISDDYVQNIFNFDSFSYSKELSLLRAQSYTKRNTQEPSTSSVNCADHAPHIDHNNKIGMPMLVHQLPLFGVELPHAINYAGHGTIYGELLAAAVDIRSSKQKESPTSHWDRTSVQEYLNRLEFYANRIGKIVPKEFSDVEVDFKINPKLYVGRAVIQYMGLVAAYKAYRENKLSKLSGPQKLIGFEDFDGDKLFFIAYAMNRCEAINAQEFASTMNVLDDSVDLPFRLTVNLALSNMRAFSKTFGCKRNDPMNSRAKCEFFSERANNSRLAAYRWKKLGLQVERETG